MSEGVLLIDGALSDCTAVLGALIDAGGNPFHFERVALCSHGIARIVREATSQKPADRIAAIIVDLYLPDSQGIETFDRLFHLAPHIPILVLAAAHDEPIAKLA